MGCSEAGVTPRGSSVAVGGGGGPPGWSAVAASRLVLFCGCLSAPYEQQRLLLLPDTCRYGLPGTYGIAADSSKTWWQVVASEALLRTLLLAAAKWRRAVACMPHRRCVLAAGTGSLTCSGSVARR